MLAFFLSLLQFSIGLALVIWAQEKSLQLDVASGRRDGMALVDDYGSNRGFHWPWGPLTWVAFLLCLLTPVTMFAVAG